MSVKVKRPVVGVLLKTGQQLVLCRAVSSTRIGERPVNALTLLVLLAACYLPSTVDEGLAVRLSAGIGWAANAGGVTLPALVDPVVELVGLGGKRGLLGPVSTQP